MHSHPHPHHHSRRDFFSRLLGGSLAAASFMDLAYYRAAFAQGLSATADPKLFDIQKVTDDVYFATAQRQTVANCNASIFVQSNYVVVVDAHSKPSAAASLIAQIKKEITQKPVRYIVDTHFHWDHSQGNAAYRDLGHVDIVASNTTKRMMTELSQSRLMASLDPAGPSPAGQPWIPEIIDAAHQRLDKATSAADRAPIEKQIRELEAFQKEMRDFNPVLPTITFDNSYVIKDSAHDLHLEFHGRAHTAGDVVIFCPQKRCVATGDMILGSTPFIADGFPKAWPETIESVGRLEFDYVLPGHGGVQRGRQQMMDLRDYIAELTERVETGKKAGLGVQDLQKQITLESLKTGFLRSLASSSNIPPARQLAAMRTNIIDIYARLDMI